MLEINIIFEEVNDERKEKRYRYEKSYFVCSNTEEYLEGM